MSRPLIEVLFPDEENTVTMTKRRRKSAGRPPRTDYPAPVTHPDEADADLRAGLVLACLMDARRWNTADLEHASGVPRAAIAEFRHGKRSPTLRTLRKLARALGVSLAEWDDPPL